MKQSLVMFASFRCTRCHRSLSRGECQVDRDGVFGPEWLSPCCGFPIQQRLTVLGWVVALSAALLLVLTMMSLQ